MGKGSKIGKTNTFRFQSFSERIEQISIKLGRSAAEPQSADTHFFEALSQWAELNCTQQFVEFHRAVADKVQSHPQLLHYKDDVSDVLQQHLQVHDSLALQPLLDLLVQFTRDLQDDFMPYLTTFVDILICLLNTHHHDADVLEWIFTCLAKLFWFLRRFLIKDLQMVYRLCSPLLSSSHYREYINTFAAESLSYLLRKAKNKDEMFSFIFSELQSFSDKVLGVGKLLFEMIKMPHRQFFGCYKQVIPMLFSRLGDCHDPDLTVLNVMKQMLKLMAVHLTAASKIDNSFSEQSLFIMASLATKLIDLQKQWLEKRLNEPDVTCSEAEPCFSHVLELLTIWIEHNSGVLIVEQDQLVNMLIQLMSGSALPASGRQSLLSVISALLLSRNCTLEKRNRSKLVTTVYTTCGFSSSEVFSFTRQLFDIALFESDVLPSLLCYCHQLMAASDTAGGDILVMLVTLLLNKAAPCNGAFDCKTWFQHYLLDFRSAVSDSPLPGKAFPLWLLDSLSQVRILNTTDSASLSTIWMMLFCLPHVVPVEKQRAVCLLSELLKDLHALSVTGHNVQTSMLLYIAEQTVTALGLMVNATDFHSYIPAVFLCDWLRLYPDSVPVLRMTDIVLSCAASDSSNDAGMTELFDDIFSQLKCNLSSTSSVVRKLTLHILCQFKLPLPPVNDDVEVEQPGVFQICFEAESTDLSMSSYRERIRHYEKLNHEYVYHQLYEGMNAQVPLHFLIGQLFVNFRPLWQPLRKLIKTYACGMSLQQFWDIFGAELQSVTECIQNGRSVAEENPTINDERDVLFSQARQMKSGTMSKPDYINMRQQLLLAMQEFPSVCEPRSRLIVPVFFRFIENEYFPNDVNFAPKQDLRPVGNTAETKSDGDIDAGEVSVTGASDGLQNLDEAPEDSMQIIGNKRSTEKESARQLKGTLACFLGLFAKFRDPKSLYQQQELRALYLDFLKSKSAKIQLAAFRCLLTYKHSYLLSYREHLESLIDEKSFRNELVLFSIDDTNSVIEDEHRVDLMPLLMRILFGKMKSGRDISRRKHGEAVKTSILAFIASSQQDEVRIFFDLIFEPFEQYLSDLQQQNVDDIETNVQTIMSAVNVAEVIPLRRLNNLLSTVRLILQKCGILVGAYLSHLFRMLVYVAAYSSALLQKRADISPRHIGSLKSVRHLAQSQIVEFFSRFDKYSFSANEIEAVFLAVVWPQLEKLPSEGVYSPTLLLKLFTCWSSNKAYQHLLAWSCQSSVTPLSSALTLLGSPRCASSVTEVVLSIVDNLLESDDEESDGQRLAVEFSDQSQTVAPFGVTLLMPHLPLVLDYLHGVVAKLGSSTSFGKHSKNKTLPAHELHILSRLSEHVDSREQCTEMVLLLLPFLDGRFRRRSELEVDILTSVRNLIGRCLQPQQFVPLLAEQFSVLSANQPRKVLCEVFSTIADFEPSLKPVAVISSKLNSCDLRFIEEPDVEQRIEGFHEAKDLLRREMLDVPFLLALVHNFCFILASSDGLSDFALRDQSSECLQILIESVADRINNDYSCDLFRVIIVQHLLSQVKAKLKLKSEVSRHAFINVLEYLVKHFPTSAHFADLVALRDASDVEVDFFRNVVHVQLHRRMKALRRLSRCVTDSQMKTETLVNYVLPIVTSMLRDPTFIKNSDRIDVAVETLGIVCRQLPWPRYLITLRYYLGETLKSIENQKLIVKILVSVLDSFHFDLRHSSFTAATPYCNSKSTTANSDTMGMELQVLENDDNITHDHVEEEAMDVSETLASNTGTGEEISSYSVCSVVLATRIHRTIVLTILPQLHKCLTKEAKADGEHKLATSGKYAEDEEILRVPLALAMVKLLQQLPSNTIDHNLPGILLKVCRFLASRAKDIRAAARNTLTKIIQSLGPAYFGYVITEMRSVLKRGYQLHVLCYSLWDILKSIVPQLHSGDLDSSVTTLTEIFNEELFGEVSEEKEVDGIVSKLFEAKTTKSLESYGILAKVVSKYTLPKLILPLKTELVKTRSSKTTRKISHVLKLISSGLVNNEGIETNYLFTYVYELLHESASDSDGTGASDEKEKTVAGRRPPNALLLKPQLPRTGSKAKTRASTNLHVLAEFGLHVLYLLLKRLGLISIKSETHTEYLDPYVSVLNECLTSKHVKVMSSALRCLLTFLRLPLPSLKKQIGSVAGHVFLLLNNYAGAGAAKCDNFELVVMCFKVLTILIRDVTYHTITEKQLHVLLVFVKQDLSDFTRQAVAFSLLKAIISRKLVDPELENIVREIRQMSIVSDAANVRQQCRQIAWQFMLDYPLSDTKLDNQYLEFYVQQLNFEHESGRISALEMLSTVFSTFPLRVLIRNSNLFFPAVASRLINDDSSICRQMAAAAIKLLLTKLDEQRKDNLFSMCVKWMSNSAKPAVLRMSAKVVGLFVEIMCVKFRRHLPTIMPLLKKHLSPKNDSRDFQLDSEVRQNDLMLFDFLSLLLKIVRHCSDEEQNVMWCGQPWSDVFHDVWNSVEADLKHPHSWVQLVSVQLFNEMFTACPPEHTVALYLQNSRSDFHGKASMSLKTLSRSSEYLMIELPKKLHVLSGSFCSQLSSANVSEQLANEIVCGLLHVARMIKQLPEEVNRANDDDDKDERRASLSWLLRRLTREIRKETSGIDKSTVKRSAVYRWLHGLAKILGTDDISTYLKLILRPLVREMTSRSPNVDSDLRQICQETLEGVKDVAGSDAFSREYAAVQQAVGTQRQQRKIDRHTQVWTASVTHHPR